MDNFFDYIIIIFFIVGAIVSLLRSKKKKEAEAQKRAAGSEEPDVPTQRAASEQVAAQKRKVLDPFEEKEYEQEKQSYSFQDFTSEVDNYFEAALKKSQEAESGAAQPVAKSQTTVVSQARPKPAEKPDVSLKESTIVDIHDQQGKVHNERTENIRRKIRNTTELRELILISEILNKPKAMRK